MTEFVLRFMLFSLAINSLSKAYDNVLPSTRQVLFVSMPHHFRTATPTLPRVLGIRLLIEAGPYHLVHVVSLPTWLVYLFRFALGSGTKHRRN